MPLATTSDMPVITVGLDGTVIVTLKGNLETSVMTYGWSAAAAFAEDMRLAAKMARKIREAKIPAERAAP